MSVKILIVEDDKNLNLMLRLVLKNHKVDWEFKSARDGVEALEVLEHYAADVALVDLEMPRMNGIELIQRIKADPRRSAIRLAVLTSRTDGEARDDVEAAGVANFWLKPIYPEVLYANLKALLG